jgi:multidrug efflux system membrane fusion protein
LRLVDPGNIVHASDSNGLLVITQVQPISVVFTIAEDQAPAVLRKMAGGKKLSVTAYDRDQKKKLADGTLTSVDNQIDPTTGTLKLRATFENSKFELFPSQFVNINLLLEQKQNVTLINSAAIQRNTDNTYVYLVKPDSTVTVRNIGLGTQQNNQTEVTSGLNPGDVVVMTGVDKLQEGSKVTVHFAGAAQGTKEAE